MSNGRELLTFGVRFSGEANKLLSLSPLEKEKFFRDSLSSFASEMLAKWVISPPFFYRIRDGRLYINSNERRELAAELFDLREREGIARNNFLRIENFLVNNPNQVVLWYSPEGKGAFEGGEDNEYTKVNYPFGQLLVYVNIDNDRVMGIPITVRNEEFLKFLFRLDYQQIFDEREKIYYYLSHPQFTDFSLVDFLEYLDSLPDNIPVHWNDEKVFYINDLLSEIIYAIKTGKTTRIETYDRVIDALSRQLSLEKEITTQVVMRGYLNLIYYHQISTEQQWTDLSAGCGGGGISRTEIESLLLGINNFNPWRNIFPPDSSPYRLFQSKYINNNENSRYPDYECPNCGETIQGEIKDRPETWKTECPYCGYKFNCRK